MARETKADRTISHALLKTAGGNSIASMDGPAWVAAGKKAVLTRVADLKPGDRILEMNTKVEVSLAEMKAALLREDPEYRLAHMRLFHYPEGKTTPITKLQQFLHTILAKRGIRPGSREGTSEAVSTIQSRLVEIEEKIRKRRKTTQTHISRVRDTIEDWLNGTTVLPSDTLTLRALRRLDQAEFDRIFGKPRELAPLPNEQLDPQKHPLLWAHFSRNDTHLTLANYVTSAAQRTVMPEGERFVLPTEEEAAEADARSALNHADALRRARQRNLIYYRFILPISQRVNRTYTFNVVKEIIPLSVNAAKRERGPKVESHPLPRGIVQSRRLPEPVAEKFPEMSVKELYRQRMALSIILQRALDAVPFKSVAGGQRGIGNAVNTLLFSMGEQPVLKESYYSTTIHSAEGDKQLVFRREEARIAIEKTLSMLANNELDRQQGLAPGTLMKIYERMKEFTGVNPAIKHMLAFIREQTILSERFKAELLNHRKPDYFKAGERIRALARKVSAYGIGPFGLIVPEKRGIRTAADLSRYLGETEEGIWKHDVKLEYLPELPVSEHEVRGSLSGIPATPTDEERLVGMFGRHNFIGLKERE